MIQPNFLKIICKIYDFYYKGFGIEEPVSLKLSSIKPNIVKTLYYEGFGEACRITRQTKYLCFSEVLEDNLTT